MASAIKTEVDVDTTKTVYCHGCVSHERKLKPLSGEIYKLYCSLLGSGVYGSEDHMICWECEATLRRVKGFQQQILQAHTRLLELFYNMSPKLETLSSLSITTKDCYDLHYEFIEETYTQTDSIFKPNEYIPESEPDSKPTSELPLIENEPVTIDNLKLEPETSEHSDYEDEFENNTNDFEISNDSSSIDNKSDGDDYKNKKKKPVKETNKDAKVKQKRNINISELSRISSAKYLKYATVKDIHPKFKQDGTHKNSSYANFILELLDLEQIEEYNAKLEQNPCGDKCFECRLDVRIDFLSILRENIGDIKPDSTKNCLLCKKRCYNFQILRKHWKTSHCAFYKCTLCNFYCKKAGRLNHLNNQHTKVYICKKCSRKFTSEHHFKLHFKKLHDTFICHHCNRGSSNRDMMIKHLIRRHADGSKKMLLKLDLELRERRKCTICNKVLANHEGLRRHIKTHDRETEENQKVEKEAAYCVECDKQFKSIALFKMHLALTNAHNPKLRKTHPCPECDKIYKCNTSLNNHIYQVHETEKAKYKCKICNKICSHKLSLKTHIEAVHLKLPKKKDKFCDLCGRGFHRMSVLKNHRRTHTGERPYKCAHCPSAFAQKVACIGHMRKQHNDTNKYSREYFFKK